MDVITVYCKEFLNLKDKKFFVDKKQLELILKHSVNAESITLDVTKYYDIKNLLYEKIRKSNNPDIKTLLAELDDCESWLFEFTNKIGVLKNENKELKDTNKISLCCELSDKLTEATNIIELLLIHFPYDMADDEYDTGSHDVVRKAEQFLKKVK